MNLTAEKWWHVIQAMADYVACGFDYDELEDEWVRQALVTQGFLALDIDQALDWLEMASMSGHVADVFSMLQPTGLGMRVASPLEKISISDKVWRQLEEMRIRGIISDDLAERLLEGIRAIDTRDWEDEDVSMFLEEVLSSTLPSTPAKVLKRLCKKGTVVPEFYS